MGGLNIAETVPSQRRLYRFEIDSGVVWPGDYDRPEGYFATCAGGAGPNGQRRAPKHYDDRLDVVKNESTFSTVGPWLIEELREVRFRCSWSGSKPRKSDRPATKT